MRSANADAEDAEVFCCWCHTGSLEGSLAKPLQGGHPRQRRFGMRVALVVVSVITRDDDDRQPSCRSSTTTEEEEGE